MARFLREWWLIYRIPVKRSAVWVAEVTFKAGVCLSIVTLVAVLVLILQAILQGEA